MARSEASSSDLYSEPPSVHSDLEGGFDQRSYNGSEGLGNKSVRSARSLRSLARTEAGAASLSGGKGGNRREALEVLLRLADALETEEPAPLDYDLETESALLGGKPSINYDLLNSFDSNPKGYSRRNLPPPPPSDDEDGLEEYTAGPFYEDSMPPAEPLKLGYPYKRRTTINWLGCLVFAIFTVAFFFYMYVRVTKTMDLGKYLGYGIFVLIVEILGGTTTFIYGLNLILDPVPDKPKPVMGKDGEEAAALAPTTALPYHVRVLVPCYKESLDIVARTIKAAAQAVMPEGCRRTIYLLDDGRDPLKRKWCSSQGSDVVYISGRKRGAVEINGKSANLNNALRQIYPAASEEDVKIPIPSYELVCVFDADQVANSDFFIKTLPLFDGGDDVGMVLSPQCFYNLKLHGDIFNHANIHFWEYAQRGYDALGFISCTGTNFLMRAKAFEECGWSPEYTLTEDYALGMELKKRKWHCRYVQEYLAIGEAPEQVRNCFQQRSRWCKGHFQIVLSYKHCPLFQKGLPWSMRFMFCFGVWSYFVGALTTPTFILIPLLTVWAGIFPIVISWWAAVGLTAYMFAQTIVLNYVRHLPHLEALWFAGISNQILWFTYVKACWRAASGLFGRTITFKTTLKGANKLRDSAIGDLWMPCSIFLVLLVTLIIGLKKLAAGPGVVTTLSISVAWIVYCMIPPYLIIHYTWVGRGSTLSFMCRVGCLLSWVASVIALLLLWAVYPYQYDFGEAVSPALTFFDAQRLGELPANNTVAWRGNAFTYEVGPGAWPWNITGGWANGDISALVTAGNLKMTMPTAMVTSLLAWSVLAFPQGYAKAGQMEHAKATVKWGSDYLLSMVAQQRNGTGIIYQVGNLTVDAAYWGTPEAATPDTVPRPTYAVNTLNGASDLGGQLVGAFVSSALVFNDSDPEYAASLMTSATQLFDAVTVREGLHTAGLTYDCTSPYAKQNIGNLKPPSECPPPTAALNGSAAVFYNSTTYRDDLTWAAAWLYKATRNETYMTALNKYYGDHVQYEGEEDSAYLYDWDHMFWAANVLLANVTGEGAFHRSAQTYLQRWVCGSSQQIKYTPRGRAWNPQGTALGQTANAAFLSLAYSATESTFISTAKRDRYTCWARGQIRYMIGDTGRSYVAGYGRKPPTRVQSAAAICPAAPEPCLRNVTLQANAPANPKVLTGALTQFPRFSDSFNDTRASNDTQVAIEWNAGFTGALAGLNVAPGTWEQCLQGFGVFSSDRAVCDGALN